MASSSNDEELETYEEDDYTIFSSEEDEPKNSKDEIPGSDEVPSKMKRRSEVTPTGKNSKRAKKTGVKRELFQNRWNEEDEIALLQGIIDLKDNTGKGPFEDRLRLIESVKKAISFEPNVRQYMDKIRHLKRKYVKRRRKGKFVKPHDLKCVDLSKFIWGEDEVNSDVVKSNGRLKKKKQDLFSSVNSSKVVKHGAEENSYVKDSQMVEEVEEEEGSKVVKGGVDVMNSDWFENSFLVGLVESLGVGSVKERWSLVPVESKKKLEDKLKLLQGKELECKKIEEMLKAKELECVRQRSDLLNELISVITQGS
ncbi:putative transcription factor [Cardamine amara subsp. amara]|uniref:Transcription factor n=1 Tax=Cardamine amara subsp. amara TaxID=228776 RepID=A0ABD1C671_CARAN